MTGRRDRAPLNTHPSARVAPAHLGPGFAYRLTPSADDVRAQDETSTRPGAVAHRIGLMAAYADGCAFARFIVDAGLADDVLDRPVRRNGNPY